MAKTEPDYQLLDDGTAAALWLQHGVRRERRYIPIGPLGPMFATFEHPKHWGKRQRYQLLLDGTLQVWFEETQDALEDGWHIVRQRRIAASQAPARIRELLDL
jgi:hypothetical protein